MADTTPVLSLPFPEGADPAAGPDAFQALAEALEDVLVPTGLSTGEGAVWDGSGWVPESFALQADLDAQEELTPWTKIGTYSAAWDPASVPAYDAVGGPGVQATTDVAVTGAAAGDLVSVSHGGAAALGLPISGMVVSADTVRVVVVNPKAGAQNPASATLKVLVLRATF